MCHHFVVNVVGSRRLPINLQGNPLNMPPRFSRKSSSGGEMEGHLIPGLPDDVSLTIMAKLPRRYHCKTLSTVCSSWRQTVRSHAFFEERKRLQKTEAWIYAAVVCRRGDRPSLRWFARSASNFADSSAWQALEPMPPHHRPLYGFRCAAIGHLLFVLGGCEWRPSAHIFPSTNRVSVFNARTNRWASAPEMITARADFACVAMDGLLMVAGGNRFIATRPHGMSWMDGNANAEAEIHANSLTSAEAYDAWTNSWTALPDMIEAKQFASGYVIDNRFAVCGFRCSADMQFREVTEMYEGEGKKWVEVDMRLDREGLHEGAVSVESDLFQLGPSEGIFLSDLNAWKALATSDMAPSLNPCRRGNSLDGLDVFGVRTEEDDTSASPCHGTLQCCQIISI